MRLHWVSRLGLEEEIADSCLGMTAVSVLITGRESADVGEPAGFGTLTCKWLAVTFFFLYKVYKELVNISLDLMVAVSD